VFLCDLRASVVNVLQETVLQEAKERTTCPES
jgi:hypothetical protein